jgi:hypothetical protein
MLTRRESTCQHCSRRFTSGRRGRLASFCSPGCRSRGTARNKGPEVGCEWCSRKFASTHKGQRFCSRRCNQASNRRATWPCKWCSTLFEPKAVDRTDYCSRQCAFEHKKAESQRRARERTIERQAMILARCELWCKGCKTRMTNPKWGKVYCTSRCRRIATYKPKPPLKRPCTVCGRIVERMRNGRGGKDGPTYCDRRCARKAWVKIDKLNGSYQARASKRKRMISAAALELVNPFVVFRRDQWVCYLCGDWCDPRNAVPHPKAATIDHVIPISLGGAHSYANIRLACFICNCTKRDQHPDALMKDIRRGDSQTVI